MQSKQSEWQYQWENHPEADELFLFQDWIYPATLEDFRGQIVLECGCGSGRHTAIVAPFAQAVTAVDLNTAGVAHRQREALTNVRFVEEDIAIMNLGQRFDIVFCVGVLHHTDDPDKTFENIKTPC